jgi:hypothetical protein
MPCSAAASFVSAVEPEADLTTEELLDALESSRGQGILGTAVRKAVRHELRVATGPDRCLGCRGEVVRRRPSRPPGDQGEARAAVT